MPKNNMPATLLCDFYKIAHRPQYPKGTEQVYATWTPRSNKHYPAVDEVISLGLQAFIKKYVIDYFKDNFFDRPLDGVLEEYVRYCKHCLGGDTPHTKHLVELHAVGYLPLRFEALPEGTSVPMRIPMVTITNEGSSFFWLTNYMETLFSCESWATSTTATIAKRYRNILDKWAMETVGSVDFVPFQGHDFSMRGMMGLEASALAGMGHLASFVGTDTIPAIHAVEEYYGGNIEKELIGCSVPATEHSVMCAGGKEDERETYRRLIEDVYPTGIISIVSDTWDLWNTLTNILPSLKDEVMARDGKVVIRPDSGDPIDIICGVLMNPYMGMAIEDHYSKAEQKGVIELLWDTFGGTTNERGFKELTMGYLRRHYQRARLQGARPTCRCYLWRLYHTRESRGDL